MLLGALLRQYGADQFDACENAVQEALLAAYEQWPTDGTPADARAWLLTAARRRYIDHVRSDVRRRRREDTEFLGTHPLAGAVVSQRDDSLDVLVLCCHPALSTAAQVTLTLRAVGGLTTAQIAHAYLLPDSTVAQRISRAKARIRQAGATFPVPADPIERLESVLAVLYLMFTAGHTASTGPSLHDTDLTTEAIRLAALVHAAVPDDTETAGLYALMLLTDARRDARTDADGRLVPLDEQDRRLWDRQSVGAGLLALNAAAPGARPGPYLLQAAIAALHAEAPSAEETDWTEILALYTVLESMTANPMVTLNRAVAEAMVHGPSHALATVDSIAGDVLPARHHRRPAVRAHLLERLGRTAEARDEFLAAARLTASLPERDYLNTKARRLTAAPGSTSEEN